MRELDEKVFEIVQIITEEWAKRTADHDPPVTSVQIVQIAESVIATKMFHMLERLGENRCKPGRVKGCRHSCALAARNGMGFGRIASHPGPGTRPTELRNHP